MSAVFGVALALTVSAAEHSSDECKVFWVVCKHSGQTCVDPNTDSLWDWRCYCKDGTFAVARPAACGEGSDSNDAHSHSESHTGSDSNDAHSHSESHTGSDSHGGLDPWSWWKSRMNRTHTGNASHPHRGWRRHGGSGSDSHSDEHSESGSDSHPHGGLGYWSWLRSKMNRMHTGNGSHPHWGWRRHGGSDSDSHADEHQDGSWNPWARWREHRASDSHSGSDVSGSQEGVNMPSGSNTGGELEV